MPFIPWAVKIALFMWNKKVFAATGIISTSALMMVFAAGAFYSDSKNEELDSKIATTHKYQYEQILWRLDSLALEQNAQGRTIDKVDRRVWDMQQQRFKNEK